MSVTDVKLLEATGGHTREGEREYVATYRVQTDAATDGPIIAKGWPGNPATDGSQTVPQFGDYYLYGTEGDRRAYLASKSAELESAEDSYKVWIVTCNFSTRKPQTCEDVDLNENNPLNVPTVWSGSFAQNQSPAGIGFTFNRVRNRYQFQPVMNSAGDPYDPPIMVDDSRPMLRAVKNYPYINLAVWVDMRDAVNAGWWYGFAPRVVKVSSITWEQIYEGACFPYVRATFEFELNPNTWDVYILDQGFRQTDWTAANPTAKQITKGGLPPQTPVMLDGIGQPLSETLINAGVFWYWRYRIYRERNLYRLGLDPPVNVVV